VKRRVTARTGLTWSHIGLTYIHGESHPSVSPSQGVGPVGLEPTTRGLKVRSSLPSQAFSGDRSSAVATFSRVHSV
jgi:hypothetical protein